MTEGELLWLAGTIIGSYIANIPIFQMLYADKLFHPVRWAFIFNIGYMIIVGGVTYFVVGIFPTLAVIFVSLFFTIIIVVYIIPKRDRKGIVFGERIINSLHTIDLQTNFVLNLIANDKNSNTETIKRAIDNSLIHILDQVLRVLSHKKDDAYISLLKPLDNGFFKILAQIGIPSQQVSLIEREFKHGNEEVGIPGKVINGKDTIYISDLYACHDPYVKRSVNIENPEIEEGSIICFLIKRGVGAEYNATPLAVLSITSKRRNAYDGALVSKVLIKYSAKIEALLYLRELVV